MKPTDQNVEQTWQGTVQEVGGGEIRLDLSGGSMVTVPANRDLEKWAATRLYMPVTFTIRLSPPR